MKEDSLDLLLATFTPKDNKSISHFLSIPIYGARPRHKLLYELLLHRTQGTTTSLPKQALHKLFKDEPYTDVKLRLLKSELKKLIEKYIDFKCVEKEKTARNVRMMSYYKNHDLSKLFDQKVNALDKHFTQSINEKEHKLKIDFELEKFSYRLIQSRNAKLNIQTILDDIDIVYCIEKLKQVCIALSHQAIYKKNYTYALLKEVLAYVKSNDLLEVPTVAVYYHCYYMLADLNDKTHFTRFVHIIQMKNPPFSPSDITSLYRFAINYCIRQLNAGNKIFLEQGLDLYKTAIDQGHFIENGYLSRFTYRNVAMMAIRSEQYLWAADFSERFASLLRSQYKESAYLFNMALINYYKKSFDSALENLIKIRIKDPLINLSIKTLQLKIYFELDSIELLLSHLDAMYAYIHRNKVLGYHKQNYLNIIKYGKRLVNLKYASAHKINLYKQALSAEKHLTEKKWFTQQVTQFKSPIQDTKYSEVK